MKRVFSFLKSRSLVGVGVREMVNVVNSSIHQALQLCQWRLPMLGFHLKLQVWPADTIYLLISAYFPEIGAGAIGIHHVRRSLSGFIYQLYTNLYSRLCWRCIQHDTGDEIQLSYWTVCLFPVKLLSFNETQHSKWCIIAANVCFRRIISFSPLVCESFSSSHFLSLFSPVSPRLPEALSPVFPSASLCIQRVSERKQEQRNTARTLRLLADV